MVPTFLSRLASPTIRTVLICGCGGGFDFLHGLLLWPELRRLGKRVVIGSCSWGDTDLLTGDVQVVFEEGDGCVKRVGAGTTFHPAYAPEVHLAAFLDERHAEDAPHHVYAYNARDFAVPALTRFFQQIIERHEVDAVLLVDGGSDSLMAGDEEGLGDPIEDAVSLASLDAVDGVELKLLLSIGLGLDRHNGVSDAASLRAVSELTAQGGFLGALALEKGQPGVDFYCALVDFFLARNAIRSAVPGVILSVLDGHHGSDHVPPHLEKRVRPGSLDLNPLMGILWAFDAAVVARRSLLCSWVREARTPGEAHAAVRTGRLALGDGVRVGEAMPTTRPWALKFLYDERPDEPA